MTDYADALADIDAAQKGDHDAANRVIAGNAGLVRSIAPRFLGRGAELDDLVQLGNIGLYKAVMSFDPNYGTRFSTYAVPKIIGEIRRFLRDDGMIKVSRSVKENAARLTRVRSELRSSLGRDPTVGELSDASGLDSTDVSAAELAAIPVDSLQRESEDGLALEGIVGDESREETILDGITLRECMARLPEKEARVIACRFYRDLTQQQTARLLGVSQVQVSRLQKRAIDRMREWMV